MKNLLLVTHDFPFGTGESFLETEIRYLSQYFAHITIVPIYSNSGPRRVLPSNVSLILPPPTSTYKKIFLVLGNFYKCLSSLWVEFSESGPLMKRKFKALPILLGYLSHALWVRGTIAKIIRKDREVCCYSYWMGVGCLSFSLLKRDERLSFITRAHGFDLFRDRHVDGIVPFQYLNMLAATKVLSVSQAGERYLKALFPNFKSRIFTSQLGVVRAPGNATLENWDSRFRILSCSSMIALKRVDLIIETFSKINDVQIEWFHIGSGPEFFKLKSLAQKLPVNITCHFLGEVSNDQVLKFYADNYVHLFIHLSASEGIPVSMMEAISHGIPLLATDVGGVSEICNAETGWLLDANPRVDEISGVLRRIIKSYDPASRKRVEDFWLHHFNAEENYRSFVFNNLR